VFAIMPRVNLVVQQQLLHVLNRKLDA
jgi:hypothetical protein